MKKQHPDFKYIYSKEIEQTIAYHKKSGWIICEDGTKYSPKEIETLKKSGGITKETHLLKKTMQGEIINHEPNRNKQTKTEHRESNNQNKNTTQPIQNNNELLQRESYRQLEIF